MKRIKHIAFVIMLAASAAGYPLAALADDVFVEAVAADCSATPVHGGIMLASNQNNVFEIYSITGQRVKSVTVDSGSVKVDLPKGCYIVRCSQWSKKVVVK